MNVIRTLEDYNKILSGYQPFLNCCFQMILVPLKFHCEVVKFLTTILVKSAYETKGDVKINITQIF